MAATTTATGAATTLVTYNVPVCPSPCSLVNLSEIADMLLKEDTLGLHVLYEPSDPAGIQAEYAPWLNIHLGYVNIGQPFSLVLLLCMDSVGIRTTHGSIQARRSFGCSNCYR